MGMILGFICIIAFFYFMIRAVYLGWTRYGGQGERQARAEHARIVREEPDSANARISEAEYVNTFFNNGPSFVKNIAIAALIAIVGIPMSCGIQILSMRDSL